MRKLDQAAGISDSGSRKILTDSLIKTKESFMRCKIEFDFIRWQINTKQPTNKQYELSTANIQINPEFSHPKSF